MSFWCTVFNSSKKRTKNFYPSRLGQKIKFSNSVFGRIEDTKMSFRNYLTFNGYSIDRHWTAIDLIFKLTTTLPNWNILMQVSTGNLFLRRLHKLYYLMDFLSSNKLEFNHVLVTKISSNL